MRVVVLTTSYPRGPDDVAGAFVRDAVEHLRAAGVDVEVVSPASFRHFGLAYGHGIVGQPAPAAVAGRAAPALPRLVRARGAAGGARTRISCTRTGFRRRCRRSRRGKPFVVQLWGTDVELARRAPWPFRWLVRRARLVLCASGALAADAATLGARDVRVVPSGVDVPETVGEPDEPPTSSTSAGSRRRRASASSRPRPRAFRASSSATGRCARVPDARRIRPAARARPVLRAGGASSSCPSRREGYGVVAREAMAYGRPVVASAVGGLAGRGRGRRDGAARPARGRRGPARGARATSRATGPSAPARRGGARACERALLLGGGDAGHARRLRNGGDLRRDLRGTAFRAR